MIVKLPTILGYSIENIKEKIKVFELIGIKEIVLLDVNNLMQSSDLTYARWRFLKNKGEEINLENYKMLFETSRRFENRHGISKKEIIELYNYKKDIENGRTI